MKSGFDIIIIGAGPIGLACALEGRRKGLQYIIIEKGALVNSLYNYPVNITFFSTSEKLEIGGVPFVSNNIKPIHVTHIVKKKGVVYNTRHLVLCK